VLSDLSSNGGHRLRVLVVPAQFPRGAADLGGIFVRDYIEAIRPHCDVTVLLPGSGERAGALIHREADGVEYIACTPLVRGVGARTQKLGRIEVLYRLGRTASAIGDIDLVHAHGPVFHGLPAVRLGRALRAPVVLTVHTGPFSKVTERRSLRFLARRTIEAADCVCAVSRDLELQIEESGIKPKRVEVTYNPVDTELFLPGVHRAAPKRFVFAGRLEEYKGALRVARAFADVAERLTGWTLAIVGNGPEMATIEAFLDAHPSLARRVDLLGTLTKAELAGVFGSARYLVYPSRHESFGLVLAEAMAAGLPVVAPDRTAPPEFVDDASGILVPPDDIEAIARAMLALAEDGARYDRPTIRKRVVERFGREAFGRRMLALYEELALERPGREERISAG
jgi:glycosyltransferase involved in cell wall biosynthesis